MDMDDDRIKYVVENTEIMRLPKQSLSTFGVTNIYYYMVTEPAYSDLVKDINETAIREGRVIAEKPRIVTPYYLSRLDGFGTEAKHYFKALIEAHGPNVPGLFYTYRNELKELTIVSENLPSVIGRLNAELDERGDPLTSIIKGQDELWDVSLLKFIHEMTRKSLQSNLSQMGNQGLLNIDSSGIPADARSRIEELFRRVSGGDVDPGELKKELDRWGVFEEYQDRFLRIFSKKR
jgi:hypothetical protein